MEGEFEELFGRIYGFELYTVNRGVFTRWGEITQIELDFLIIIFYLKFPLKLEDIYLDNMLILYILCE